MSLNRRFRNSLSFGFNDTILLSQKGSTDARGCSTIRTARYSERADQAQADDLLGNFVPTRHTLKGNFVWALPQYSAESTAMKTIGYIVNDWQLSGVWTANTGTAYTVGVSLPERRDRQRQPEHHRFARLRRPRPPPRQPRLGLQQRSAAAVHRRRPSADRMSGSDGLESGADYLRGCFQSAFDMAIARTIRLHAQQQLQFRLDMFNAFNQAIVTNRNATVSLASPLDQTMTNLPYDASGNVVASRSLPKNAGFGVATAYQAPRTLQAQIRFSF